MTQILQQYKKHIWKQYLSLHVSIHKAHGKQLKFVLSSNCHKKLNIILMQKHEKHENQGKNTEKTIDMRASFQ